MSEEAGSAELGILPKLTNPLSDVTRKERVYLLGTSAIGITIVFTGLIPMEIIALGIQFAQADRRSLLIIFAFVVANFLIAFAAYALSDYVEWQSARRDLSRRKRRSEVRLQRLEAENKLGRVRLGKMDPSELEREGYGPDPNEPITEVQVRRELAHLDQQEQVIGASSGAPFGLAEPVIIYRFILEFIAALAVGIFAIGALLIRAL